MPRECPHIPGFTCPMMMGLECPELPGNWTPGSPEAKLGQCRVEAMRAGFLTRDATGKYDRKEGYRPGEGPEWRRKDGR